MKAFLFPGQGSQYSGMGEDFLAYESAEEYYKRAEDILGFDIVSVMNGDEETLKLTENAQPAIFLTSFIAFKEMERKGYSPDISAGHSLGEYTAFAAAGVYDFDTGIYIVRKRGEFISEALEPGKGTMAAIIGLPFGAVEEVVSQIDGVWPANYNDPTQIVISGLKESVHEAMEILKEKGARKVVELKVSGPFHTPLIEKAAEKMEQLLSQIKFHSPKFPVVLNVTAKESTDPEEMKRYLIEQIVSPVKWVQSMERMKELGVKEYFEVGPKNVLKGLGRKMGIKVVHFSEVIKGD
jgi:[acyl-carrier-protein] S-malonyltransferase